MSRIIVKNLPSGAKEGKVRSLFSQKGEITDCSLKYTKDGIFRKFAFIGYRTSEEAKAAVKFFNQSYMNTSKLQVELAKDLTDPSKPRAWSKYSQDSSAFQRSATQPMDNATQPKGKAEKEDLGSAKKKEKKKGIPESPAVSDTEKMDVSSSSEASEEENEEEEEEEEEESDTEKAAAKQDLSDLDYLKSKVTKKPLFDDDDDESDGDNNGSDGESDSGSDSEVSSESGSDSNSSSSTSASSSSSSSDEEEEEDAEDEDEDAETEEKPDQIEEMEDQEKKASHIKYLVKMRGLPASVKEKQIEDFFKPLKAFNIKIPQNAKGKKVFCVATVEFENEKTQEQAMRRNKNFIGPKRIYLHKLKVEEKTQAVQKAKPWELKQKEDEEIEPIGESGRLYVRNLAYCCTEEDLEATFSTFGPLTEVHLPIDSFTKKTKGFAFVTFMMPEHAVKAYTQLDGSVFMGRMLHLLAAKAKKEDSDEINDNTTFKQKRDLKQKATAGSSHNWNSLFLGANAVADVIAEKYGTSKQQILDPENRESLGVRMALGETQVVMETREFLLEHDVALDSFSQPDAPRSKTVILVKNLPAATKAKEITDVFAKYGSLGRLVLPPSGVTALVEFLEPTEARNAFRSLAYTKFHHVPLYLEWAPVEVFKSAPASSSMSQTEVEQQEGIEQKGKVKVKDSESESSEEEDEEPEPGSTLFVKNLNFDTIEDDVRKVFEKCGPIKTVSIAKKKDMKNIGQMLSMGYGFVEYKKKESAEKALKQMQHTMLDGHQLELKISNRATVAQKPTVRKKQDTKKKQRSTKILVRNIPFEAKMKEVRDLFVVFGELKSVRLPKKLSGTGSHRGFAFVDFLTKHDAKRAFNALCHSTHLYGRRLVLEWAETEESVDQLRMKTAQHFFDEPIKKKMKKSSLMEELKMSETVS